MSTPNTLIHLSWRALAGASVEDCLVAFLCGGLVRMGFHRKLLRDKFIRWLDAHARDGEVSMRLRLKGHEVCLLMRQGNLADYAIGGEMLWGAYESPSVKPATIVDGGANIGMFAIVAHARFPGTPIICYEPDTDNLLQLERNLKINQVPAKVVPKGLWSSETTLYFHPGLSYTGYIDQTPSEFPIACTTPEISEGCWLKLDIEGSEYEVLPQVLKQSVKPAFISMEIHQNDTAGAGLVRQLESAGYRLRTPHDPSPDCVTIDADREAPVSR